MQGPTNLPNMRPQLLSVQVWHLVPEVQRESLHLRGHRFELYRLRWYHQILLWKQDLQTVQRKNWILWALWTDEKQKCFMYNLQRWLRTLLRLKVLDHEVRGRCGKLWCHQLRWSTQMQVGWMQGQVLLLRRQMLGLRCHWRKGLKMQGY